MSTALQESDLSSSCFLLLQNSSFCHLNSLSAKAGGNPGCGFFLTPNLVMGTKSLHETLETRISNKVYCNLVTLVHVNAPKIPHADIPRHRYCFTLNKCMNNVSCKNLYCIHFIWFSLFVCK